MCFIGLRACLLKFTKIISNLDEILGFFYPDSSNPTVTKCYLNARGQGMEASGRGQQQWSMDSSPARGAGHLHRAMRDLDHCYSELAGSCPCTVRDAVSSAAGRAGEVVFFFH